MLKKILPIVSMVFLSVIIAACQQSSVTSHAPIAQSKEVADSSSPLLKILMQESDFVDDWYVVMMDHVFQGPITATLANDYLVENAFHVVAGQYGLERYYIKAIHALERYQQPIWPTSLTTPQGWGFTSYRTYTPTLTSTGQPTMATCTADRQTGQDKILVCEIAVNYDALISRVIFWGVTAMADSTVDDMLNQISLGVDNRVKEIEGDLR